MPRHKSVRHSDLINMKRVSDSDIETMASGDFSPDVVAVRRDVRRRLKLSELVPTADGPVPEFVKLDLHQHTVEQAWEKLMSLATSGVRRATVITGASGVLRTLFPQWARNSILAPYIISATPLNNGSFDVRFRRKQK